MVIFYNAVELMANWVGFGRKRPWPDGNTVAELACSCDENHENLSVPAGIRTKRLPHTTLERDRYASPALCGADRGAIAPERAHRQT
jgi:hypothetical protein